jgi:pimeloyl-ACP methyl ester carboxylesterase
MSPDSPETFAMADWARILAEFFDALGIDRGCLLGLSWGGVLAQEFYRAHASRILALLLADTYAGWKGSLAPPAVEQRLARCLHDSSLPADEFVPRWVPEMFTRAVSTSVIEEMSTIMSAFHPFGFGSWRSATACCRRPPPTPESGGSVTIKARCQSDLAYASSPPLSSPL